MRKLNGDVVLDPRADGRAVLVLRSATGERFGMDRSPDQLRALRGEIDTILSGTVRPIEEPGAPAVEAPEAPETEDPEAPEAAPPTDDEPSPSAGRRQKKGIS